MNNRPQILTRIDSIHDAGQTYAEARVIARWPMAFQIGEAYQALLTGLATLEVALPASAEGAIAAAAVDDGLAANEEVGDAL